MIRVKSEQLACRPIGLKNAAFPVNHQVASWCMLIKRLKMRELGGQVMFVLCQLSMLKIQLDLMGLQFVEQFQGIGGTVRVAGQTVQQ